LRKRLCAAAFRTLLPVAQMLQRIGIAFATATGYGRRVRLMLTREAEVMRTLLMGLLLLIPGGAFAEPVDLLDPTPRWIEVAFEVSPRDKPEQTDTVYTPRIRAWLDAGDSPGRMQVTIDRHDVEGVLLAPDEPVAGSFSDFVWIFDVLTGEVVSASLDGILTQELDWGLFRSKVPARIAVDMGTNRVGGFKKPRNWLGQQIFGYCDAQVDPSCNVIAASGYDATSGYVNAIGDLSVRFGDLKLRTFSPLGEAVFSEAGQNDVQPAVTAAGAIAGPGWVSLPDVSAAPAPLH
jgi:hypothetical protein